MESSVNPPFVRSANTVLDATNFRSFDWFNPTRGASSASAQIFANSSDYHGGGHASLESYPGTYVRWHSGIRSLCRQQGSTSGNSVDPQPGASRIPVPSALVSGGRIGEPSMSRDMTATPRTIPGSSKCSVPSPTGLRSWAAYTWSKAIDDTGGTFVGEADRGGGFQDSYNRQAEKGLAGQDIRHRFVFSYVYELPFGKGKPFLNGGVASHILGNWQINGITTFQTGSPFTVTQAFNGANIRCRATKAGCNGRSQRPAVRQISRRTSRHVVRHVCIPREPTGRSGERTVPIRNQRPSYGDRAGNPQLGLCGL